MPDPQNTLSTSDVRRETVIQSAVQVFAQAGYLGTPVSAVAEHARISPAYVFKLFPRKEELFVAALHRCFLLIQTALERGAAAAPQTPAAILEAMGAAYAALIADRSLLMLQVHAQSAASVPEIAAALRSGIGQITTFVKERSQAPDEAVQQFVAFGQLCHLITVAGLDDDSADWARLLSRGIQHF
ncbi:TetR/AcrR family transcriptional regulator (plasmid) [Deinococcus sp. KNUC1210]|uniref:TetR/AcrR family transcriptional regulator n=1 Tax=Deinococcus sp. KNUC1210 TaxID=2917691 RepID=UPI001EEFB8CB|nr:helix-turn-helix domain-containing protein [Deinococcus sp. KNUC1210]ULH17788.1 TetR/AcrR family transcriptional regulator [Deinococcus sp. KNUC1210]